MYYMYYVRRMYHIYVKIKTSSKKYIFKNS